MALNVPRIRVISMPSGVAVLGMTEMMMIVVVDDDGDCSCY